MNIFSRFTAGKKIIFACVISGAAVAVAGWAFFWLAGSIAGGGAVRDAIIVRTRAVAAQRESARVGSQVLESRAADIARIKSFFINRRDPVAFVDDLERTVRATGSTVALAVDESAGTGADLVFHATVQGTQENILRSVRAMDFLPYFARIEEVGFARAPANNFGAPGAGNMIQAILTIRVSAL